MSRNGAEGGFFRRNRSWLAGAGALVTGVALVTQLYPDQQKNSDTTYPLPAGAENPGEFIYSDPTVIDAGSLSPEETLAIMAEAAMDPESRARLERLREKCWFTDGIPIYYPRLSDTYKDGLGIDHTLTGLGEGNIFCELSPTHGNQAYDRVITRPAIQDGTGAAFITYQVFSGSQETHRGATLVGE